CTDFTSFGYISSSGIAGLYSSSLSNFLRSHHTVFHNDSTNLHSHQRCVRVPFFPYPCQEWFSFIFLEIVILIRMRSCFIVVFICISLMISDAEHFFIYLLAICMFSFEKCLLRSFAHFKIRLCFCLLLLSSLYILDISPL
uniref:Uncharacterized protein n=1 Tax=Macaca mulatta TaxID=9544 RepID=A0A5F7ZTD1_MACMU